MNQLVKSDAFENALVNGDLEKLTSEQRLEYYKTVCDSVGLNPFTRPFEYIKLNGKLTLYAKRDAADQLRKLNHISLQVVSQSVSDGMLTVLVRATDRHGRTDEDLGVVPFPTGLAGEARANAVLKAVTKAKRRVTLSISGLGFLDETEVETIPEIRRQTPRDPATGERKALMPPHDPETGEVLESGIPDFLDRRSPAAKPAGESAPSQVPPATHPESGADNDESRIMFIHSTEDHIQGFDDAKELADWWKSTEQKRARRDFGLNTAEVDHLVELVKARHGILTNGGNGK
jgi:hypothetical protein